MKIYISVKIKTINSFILKMSSMVVIMMRKTIRACKKQLSS